MLAITTFYTARSAGQKGCVNKQQLRSFRGRLEIRAVIGQYV